MALSCITQADIPARKSDAGSPFDFGIYTEKPRVLTPRNLRAQNLEVKRGKLCGAPAAGQDFRGAVVGNSALSGFEPHASCGKLCARKNFVHRNFGFTPEIGNASQFGLTDYELL
jgi:hypothetical protein